MQSRVWSHILMYKLGLNFSVHKISFVSRTVKQFDCGSLILVLLYCIHSPRFLREKKTFFRQRLKPGNSSTLLTVSFALYEFWLDLTPLILSLAIFLSSKTRGNVFLSFYLSTDLSIFTILVFSGMIIIRTFLSLWTDFPEISRVCTKSQWLFMHLLSPTTLTPSQLSLRQIHVVDAF